MNPSFVATPIFVTAILVDSLLSDASPNLNGVPYIPWTLKTISPGQVKVLENIDENVHKGIGKSQISYNLSCYLIYEILF